MPQDWLVYWVPEQVRHALKDGVLDHAAGEQLSRTKIGDRLWICGTPHGRELCTVGYVLVDQKVGQEEAEEWAGQVLYESNTHVLPPPDDICKTRRVGLSGLYRKLTFVSPRSRILRLVGGHPPAQQLQTIRRLTPASAALMEQLWSGETARQAAAADKARQASLRGMERLDRERTTLARQEQQLVRALLIDNAETGDCGICGKSFPAGLLVAAHIKPRASCTEAERRDIASNVILMCRLGCDDLFERGYLTVRRGTVLRGPAIPVTAAVRSYVDALAGSRCPAWSAGKERYFAWRADHLSD